MVNKFFILLSLLCICAFMIGCSMLFSGQEWSDNYALLDGTKSTSMEATDGDVETIGHAKKKKKAKGAGRSSPELVVTLPEKKIIRKIIIRSDNLKKFSIYMDKGGSALADTDWVLIKEVQSVKRGVAVVTLPFLLPTDKVKLVPVGTTAIREIELFGFKTDKDIKDEPITKDDRIIEDDPIEEEDTDQFDPLLY